MTRAVANCITNPMFEGVLEEYACDFAIDTDLRAGTNLTDQCSDEQLVMELPSICP